MGKEEVYAAVTGKYSKYNGINENGERIISFEETDGYNKYVLKAEIWVSQAKKIT